MRESRKSTLAVPSIASGGFSRASNPASGEGFFEETAQAVAAVEDPARMGVPGEGGGWQRGGGEEGDGP